MIHRLESGRLNEYTKRPREWFEHSGAATEGKFRMTNTSNTADPRVEAAAAAMWEQRPMMRTPDGAPRPWEEVPAWSYGARYRGQARVALAAADAVDPHKPRTITDRFEDNGPDELAPLSVVLSAGKPAIMQQDGTFMDYDGTSWDTWEMTYPLTVIHEPEAEATR